MVNLSGKSIAITGASSGIGAAVAIACARAGMNVCISARRADKLNAVAQRARDAAAQAGANAKVLVHELDVCDAKGCADMIAACVREFGSLYAVFANAGYGEEIPMHEMSEAHLRRMFETNFYGTVNVLRPAIPLFRANHKASGEPRAHIVICSSCLAQLPLPCYGAYGATKAAQHHLGRAMKLELEPFGIAVTTLHPIGTKTEFFETVEERTKSITGTTNKLVSHSPDTFMQTPEYVAKLFVRNLRRPRAELWPGPMGHFVRFGMSVLTMFPNFADFFLRGMVKRRTRPGVAHAVELQSKA